MYYRWTPKYREHDFSILRDEVLGPCLRLECMQLVPSSCAVKTQHNTGSNKCVPLMSAFRIIRERKMLNAVLNTEATETVIGSITKLSVEVCAGKV